MGKVKKIVDGVVVEVDEQTMVKVIENGVVVEKPFSEVKQQPSQSPTPEKKNVVGASQPSPLRGLGGSSDGNVPSPLSPQEIQQKSKLDFGTGNLDRATKQKPITEYPTKGLEVPKEAIVGIGGTKKLKEGEWKSTELPKEEEVQFRDFMTNDPNVIAWAEEFKSNYGEYPSIDNSNYDYRGAWKAGQTPTPVNVDGKTEYHWGSIGENGKELKSPDHTTRWKSDYMQVTGKNPDEEGVSEASAKGAIKGANLANNVISKALNPPADIGQSFIDGQLIPNAKMRQYAQDRDFMKSFVAGERQVDIQGNPELRSYVRKQGLAIKNGADWYDNLVAGVIDAKKGAIGFADWTNDVLGELTGIPNFLEGIVGVATQKGQVGEIQKALAKTYEQVDLIENDMFEVDGQMTDLYRQGKWGEMGNLAVNTSARSAANSLLIGTGAALTGGLVAGGAAVAPIFVGGAYADQERNPKAAGVEDLSKFNRMITRPLAYGSAELTGEIISVGLLKGSTNIMMGSLRSTVKKVAETAGKEAAEQVAKEGAGTIAKNLFDVFVGNPSKEGFSEVLTFAQQKFTDKVLGINNESTQKILKDGINTWALGAASGGVTTAPQMAVTAISSANTARKKFVDYTIKNDPDGLTSLQEAIKENPEQYSTTEQDLKVREKAVNAVPDNLVENTEVVDKVQEKQALEEQKRNLDPVFAKTIEEEIAKIDEELAKVASEPKKKKEEEVIVTEPVINSTPTDERYASVNNNDGKGTIDLTKQEYLDWKAKNKPVTEQLTTSKTEQNAKEQQSEQMREQGVQEQPQGESDSNMPIVNQTELQDGQTPKEEVVGAGGDVEVKVGDKVVDADGVEYEVLELSTSRKGVPQAVVKLPNRTEEQLQEAARANVFGRNENRLLYKSPNDPKFLKEQSVPIAQELSDQRAINNSATSSTTIDLVDLKIKAAEQSLKKTPQAGSIAVGGDVESRRNKQLEIINKTNPAPNNYNTWIRKVEDIKTADEVFEVAKKEGAMYPDFTEEQMQDALDSGEITIYSSNPIENGVFVTPSKMNAQEYAGGKGGKLYSKKVKLEDIAWIDESEGQYAVVEQPQAEPTKEAPKEPVSESKLNKPFAESFGVKTTKLPTKSKALGITLGGVNVGLSDVDANTVKLEGITTPEEKRNQGKAKAALKKITEEADKQNKTITLEVVPEEGVSTEEGLRKLYEGFGFVATEGKNMERVPNAEVKETKAEVTPEVKEVAPTEQAATREELQKELYKLFDKKDATDVFDVEDMQAVDKEIERVSALLEALPKEETQIAPEQEFTDEEIAIAYAERQDALKEIDSKEYKSRQIHNMFTKIPLHEYLAMGDRKYYKGSEKFFRNLVDKDAPSTQNSIEDMANEMSEAAGIEITESDIIKYIEDIVADRIKGEDSFGAKELKSKKGAPKKGRKAPTVSRKEKLLAERKALIDKIKSGLNNQGIAFDPKNAANDSRALLNDLIKWAQIEIELGSITAKEFIDMVIKEKGYDWRGPARRAYTIGLQTMPDVPFKDVKEKVRLLEKAALAEITSAMKKGKREGIKEGEQKEKEKAEKAKEKAREAAKESKEKAVEKAIEKAKQKYVNIGARIGEAFGNLEGQIAGKAKGIKEAAQMQKWFTQQVNTILEDMIAEAKESNPGFSIAPRQLAAITKKLLSVNPFNENSYAKAVEYMGKVLEDATYADNVSRANKLKKDNTKRLNRNDYGIDDGSMRQALKVNVEDLSIDELSEYLDFLEGISAGPYNKAKNIPLVNKYAEIYREQKSKAQEPLSDKMVLANEARQISRSEAKDEALNEFEYERQSMLEPVSEAYKKDYLFIKSLTNEELSNLSEKQLQELSNAIRNMRDEVGFMSGNAANTVRELQAERLAVKANEISEGRAFKQLVRDIILPLKVSFKGGIEKLTDSEKYKRLISMMPLSRIDSAMKGITGQQIHDAFIQPISTAFSVFTEKINQIESGYDKLYSKVGKSILPWKREQQRQDEMVKISLIAIQKEFEDNPYNEEISSPLSDYIEAIREAAKANEEYAKLADRYIEIYESMLDENGQFDYKKQEELLDKDTYNFYKYAQEINASNAQFVEVSAIRNGENISLRQSYTPISVALMEYSNLSEVQEMADKFTSNENVTPTAKSGNIKKRTKGAKPLYLDYHRNAKRATRSVLLDYYMREPLRVASKAFNKISKDIGMSADSRAFFKGLEANIAQVVKNVFVNEFYDEGLKTLIAETLKKRGYQMALASVPRAGVEFGTNLSHAIINKPKELMEGSQILYKYKGNDEDLRTLAIFSESAQISRMFGKSTSIMAEQGSNTKGSATTYGRVVDQMADSIMSAPDRAVARPLWIGSFSRTFREASGSELDIQEFINNPKYRQENAAAIAKARNVADANLSQGFASMNPFEGVVASQVTRADGLIDLYDKYMTRFMRYEFQSSVDAINALMGRNEMSKAQGAALLAATIIRMSAYQFAMSYAVDMFYSLIESATGTGDEEDEKKDVVEKISSSLTGAIISMLVFRRLGNWAKAPIAWGIETLNKNFGEEVGLRKGEYDDYKSPVVFSPLAGDIKGSDLDAEKLLPKFMGPYGPMAKTAFRFKDLMVKRGLEDGMGGYVIEPSETSETEIKKINEEIAFRIMPELVMQSIGAPIPRDVRNLIIRDVFKDYKKTAKEGSATQKGEQEDLKKKERKDAIVKETVNSLSVKVKKNPLNPLGLATKANVMSAYGGEVNVLNAKKEIGEFPYEEILKKHNIEAIKEMKDKNFKKAFITVNGSGDDYEDSKIFARHYFDGVSPKAISAEHAAIIKKTKTLEYFYNFEKEYNKYRNPK